MKKNLLLLTSFLLTGTMMARQLTPDEALALALGKMKTARPVSTKGFCKLRNGHYSSERYHLL